MVIIPSKCQESSDSVQLLLKINLLLKKEGKKWNLECIHCLAYVLHAKANCALVTSLLNNVSEICVKHEYN